MTGFGTILLRRLYRGLFTLFVIGTAIVWLSGWRIDSQVAVAVQSLIDQQPIPPDSLEVSRLYEQVSQAYEADLPFAYFSIDRDPHHIWMPSLSWHGTDCRWHRWQARFWSGEWGISQVDRAPVRTRIAQALVWTVGINLVVAILAILGGIWLGSRSLSHRSWWLLLYTIPPFLLGILGITFFSTAEYHPWLDWFPSGGTGLSQGQGGGGSLVYHLILPISVLTIPSLYYVAQLLRAQMIDESKKTYALAAELSGYDDEDLRTKHILRNALNPVLVLIGGLPAGLISGSVIVEVLFSLPGMGRLLFQSILSNDWVVVFPIMMLTGILVWVGYALLDVLLYLINPGSDRSI